VISIGTLNQSLVHPREVFLSGYWEKSSEHNRSTQSPKWYFKS
jgi:DNA repair protein RadC